MCLVNTIPFPFFYIEEFTFDFGSFQILLVFLTLTFKECPNGEGWGEEWGGSGGRRGRVGWEVVKGGLKEDDLLQVLGFLMMDIFRSVSNFQVGLHF